MQGRRRAKRIKARRRLFYPCILGGRCNALPPPGPGDSPSIGTAAGPAKRQKAGLLTAQCAAPPAQVGGVSDVECPERGRSGAGPTKGRGLGGGYTFQGCGNIGRYAVAPGRESARGRYRGLAVFGDGMGMVGAAPGVGAPGGPPPPPGCYSGHNLVRWLRQKERGPALSGWPSLLKAERPRPSPLPVGTSTV